MYSGAIDDNDKEKGRKEIIKRGSLAIKICVCDCQLIVKLSSFSSVESIMSSGTHNNHNYKLVGLVG